MEKISCRKFLSEIDQSTLHDIYIEMGYDRMIRKYNFIKDVFHHACDDWNQTFYEMLFRTMDATSNKEVYHRLARAIPYRYIMREANSLIAIEAMLIGGSGLLFLYPEDEYVARLKEEWNHLANKYELQGMRFSEWNLGRTRPYNHPVLRLAQLATLLHTKEFFVNQIIECKTPDDVEALFSVEASEYWKNHFIPACESRDIPKRLGREKCYLLGINLVVQLQYAYSFNVGKDYLKEQALDLFGMLPAENNKYIRAWQKMGLYPRHAFDSQSIIQIVTEYCQKNRCDECLVMKYAHKKAPKEVSK